MSSYFTLNSSTIQAKLLRFFACMSFLATAQVAQISYAEDAFIVPPFTAPVVDQAGLLSADISALNQTLLAIQKQGGPQIGVLTVTSLNGEVLEQASIKVADKWKMGTAEKDDGILILISRDDRSVRIEVGQGLEGSIPDAYARRVVDNVMLPYFKQQDFGSGVLFAVEALVKHSNPEIDFASIKTGSWGHKNFSTSALPSSPTKPKFSWFGLLVIIFLIWFFVFTKIGRMALVMMLLSQGGGGRGGRGGSFGGGFGGGGGGGFSGGGASGRW
ncbi:MAG: TPM domain-containing protein [Oligoflexales bacterium]|nr:TPM domain-containing protein [Oligoflexales bacterium]